MKTVKEYLSGLGASSLLHPAGAGQVTLRRVPAGQTVCGAGEPLRSLQLLAEGTLRVLSLSAEGNHGAVASAQPPKLVGDIEFFQKKPFLHRVVAQTDAVLICFPLSYIQTYLENQVEFYRFLCLELAAKLYATSFSYSRSLTLPARNRFADWLLSQADGEGQLHLVLTRAAEALGITPRHATRLLGEFRQAGLVEKQRAKCYRLADLPGLQALANAP